MVINYTINLIIFIISLLSATSLDGLKKSKDYPGSLKLYYEKVYGKDTPSFKAAIHNYVTSMAGYSIVCYLLGIKDRCILL